MTLMTSPVRADGLMPMTLTHARSVTSTTTQAVSAAVLSHAADEKGRVLGEAARHRRVAEQRR